MNSTLRGRLHYANGLLYDVGQWIDQIIADEPALREVLSPGVQSIHAALDTVGEAQKQVRQAEEAVADAAQEKIA